MGRRPKTKAEHELSGTFEKHPERRARYAKEPKPAGPLGDPPTSFNPEMSVGRELIGIWQELVSQAPPGVLTSSDRAHVELACRLMYRVRHSLAKSGDYARLESLLGKMAMNPSDRTKVNIEPNAGAAAPKQKNAGTAHTFAKLAAEDGHAQTVQ